MPWMAGCPADQGVLHGPMTDVRAVVLHRTYGYWPGDYSVGKQGIFQFLIGKADGNWVQFAPSEDCQWHCNGANRYAVGIELEGTNDDPLTDWQAARLGDVLRWVNATHGVPLEYLDPFGVAPASVWVNSGNFRGVISHVSVKTDDGSSQHGDFILPADFQRALGATPAGDDVTPEQMATLGQWMQEQRALNEKQMAEWMQQQSANVVKLVNAHVDAKIAQLEQKLAP